MRSFVPITQRQPGFSILEIAVVLTVIGLIIGGVLTGRILIKNAALQSVITDVNRFKSAAKLFRDKYYYLPGDLPNAAALWGRDTTCTAGTPDTDSTADNSIRKAATCGGDGNGYIGGFDGTSYSSPTYLGDKYKEAFRAWQHLSNAGLMDGIFSGVASGVAGKIFMPGVNIPDNDLGDNGGFLLFYSHPLDSLKKRPDGTDNVGAYPSNYGHIISFGKTGSTSTVKDGLNYPVITSANALAIDSKIDDGKPTYGSVMSFTTNNVPTPKCTTGATVSATYLINSTYIVSCALIFITGL